MLKFPSKITYSKKLVTKDFEYRNVMLDVQAYSKIIPGKIMKPQQWRALGISGSYGWEHYKIDRSKPHVIMLRKQILNNPLENFEIFKLINQIVESENNEIIHFRRQNNEIVTQKIIERKEDCLSNPSNISNNQENINLGRQSFDVPQIKLFGRDDSQQFEVVYDSNKSSQCIVKQLSQRSFIKSPPKKTKSTIRTPELSPIFNQQNKIITKQQSKKQFFKIVYGNSNSSSRQTVTDRTYYPQTLQFKQKSIKRKSKQNTNEIKKTFIPKYQSPIKKPLKQKDQEIVPLEEFLFQLQRK